MILLLASPPSNWPAKHRKKLQPTRDIHLPDICYLPPGMTTSVPPSKAWHVVDTMTNWVLSSKVWHAIAMNNCRPSPKIVHVDAMIDWVSPCKLWHVIVMNNWLSLPKRAHVDGVLLRINWVPRNREIHVISMIDCCDYTRSFHCFCTLGRVSVPERKWFNEMFCLYSDSGFVSHELQYERNIFGVTSPTHQQNVFHW